MFRTILSGVFTAMEFGGPLVLIALAWRTTRCSHQQQN
jgi:hypothetical protein